MKSKYIFYIFVVIAVMLSSLYFFNMKEREPEPQPEPWPKREHVSNEQQIIDLQEARKTFFVNTADNPFDITIAKKHVVGLFLSQAIYVSADLGFKYFEGSVKMFQAENDIFSLDTPAGTLSMSAFVDNLNEQLQTLGLNSLFEFVFNQYSFIFEIKKLSAISEEEELYVLRISDERLARMIGYDANVDLAPSFVDNTLLWSTEKRSNLSGPNILKVKLNRSDLDFVDDVIEYLPMEGNSSNPINSYRKEFDDEKQRLSQPVTIDRLRVTILDENDEIYNFRGMKSTFRFVVIFLRPP